MTDSPDKVLPYACVRGVVAPIGAPVKSQHTDKVGVVLHELLVEHKSKRTQGFWFVLILTAYFVMKCKVLSITFKCLALASINIVLANGLWLATKRLYIISTMKV